MCVWNGVVVCVSIHGAHEESGVMCLYVSALYRRGWCYVSVYMLLMESSGMMCLYT